MMVERRAFSRLPVVYNAYAALKIGIFKIGRIQNISMNGLMFTYLGLNASKNTSSEVDLFLLHESFYLPDLPCNVIYCAPKYRKNNNLSFTHIGCGLKFGTLDRLQKEQLNQFLNRSANYQMQSND